MTYSVATATDEDGIAVLTMDLPGQSMNTLGGQLLGDLQEAFAAAVANPSVRGVVIASGKDGFLAGADLKSMDAGNGAEREPLSVAEQVEESLSLSRTLRAIETAGKPVAVLVNGVAAGGGLEVALACHYRVVADDPTIRLGLPEVSVGLIPGGGGTQRLPRLIGIEQALPLLTQGTLVDPPTALRLGFVDAVVPREEMLANARAWLLEVGDPVAPWDKKGFEVPGGTATTSKRVGQLFTIGNAATRARTYANLPAVTAVAAAVYEGTQLPFDTALRVEGKYFHKVYIDSTSKALIRTMFVSKQAADKLVMRPDGYPKAQYPCIGIIGAGTMGAGLALNAARSRIKVILIDTTEEKAHAGRDYAEKQLRRAVEKGRTTEEKAAQTLSRIHATSDMSALAGVPIVVEAVFESLDVKRSVIESAEQVLPEDTTFASNTSGLPITELAGFSRRPAQFIGMHFFSPAERMPLVEVIRGAATSDETLAKALDLVQVLRKTPVVVNDSPGFYTTRFIGSFIGESFRMVQSGVTPALLENGAKMLGMPQGALAISDAIGLDVGQHGVLGEVAALPDDADLSRFPLSSVLAARFGRRGRKSGAGFYDYPKEGTPRLWTGLAGLVASSDHNPSIDEVKERILYAQLAEGARAFSEGVLLDVIDGDLGAVLGVGFPAHLGGPFTAMDAIGIPRVVAVMDRLVAAHGEQFAAPELLRTMATNGQTFYGRNAVASPGHRRATAVV
ncbi:3-hydroxyacyl-CoA dehydrogenase NAD-binding domain-containing protein [Dactylosporangium sp. NPDC005572]|uniref:3-hydroxyacyl-CoA dehydrogenase NAD-binding domain-containing protein n=1 Tax=Dactylosporangium sp. NPDC005572 TaxID=3156889 RepID=UPI0033AE6D4B